MLIAYQKPGVYYERVDAQASAINPLRTDIAGFVGLAERGRVDAPVPVESYRQFEAHFGGFTRIGYLAYAVRGFFENGGRRAWIARVASKDVLAGCAAASVVLGSVARDVWRIDASSPGVWGNNLTIRITETNQAQCMVAPHKFDSVSAAVASTAGLSRATAIRIWQDGAVVATRVISLTDAPASRIYWVHPDPEWRLPYDAPLLGVNPDLPLLIESVEYSLAVFQSGQLMLIRERLSTLRENDFYGPRVLGPPVNPTDASTLNILPPPPAPVVIVDLRPADEEIDTIALDTDSFRLTGGRDGLALLTADDFIGEPIDPNDSDTVRASKFRGLETLGPIDEISILAIPDIHIHPAPPPETAPPVRCVPDPCLDPRQPPLPIAGTSVELPPVFSDADLYRVQAAMVEQCETLGDRFAVLETPYNTVIDPTAGPAAAQAWRSRFDSKYAALYYPWVRVVDPLRQNTGTVRDIPPSGHIVGQYAATDLETGVHKAPANNPLEWLQDVTSPVGNELHALFNTAGINVLRSLPGRRIRILGARTVSSDPDWRFVNVRRLLIMIERALYISLQWAVFELNGELTWGKIRLAITSFLITLWQAGALVGESMAEAFFVKCDEETNSARERDIGRLICLVGVAPSQPFEFVVLRVGRAGNEFEVQEMNARGGGV
jgi:phage tail sheath protein FI